MLFVEMCLSLDEFTSMSLSSSLVKSFELFGLQSFILSVFELFVNSEQVGLGQVRIPNTVDQRFAERI